MKRKILLITEAHIKENSIIETNVNSKLIKNSIKEVQDIELLPILGKDGYAALLEKVFNESTTPLDEDTKELLADYIQPFLVYGTLVYTFLPIHYKFTNSGIVKKNAEDSSTVDKNELEYVKDNYDTKFDLYKQRLINHLSTHNENVNHVDTTGFSTGWYLDGDDNQIELYNAQAYKTGYIRR